ncbi:MAG: A24 family peptidase [Gammaproteobacteria bacterium]|jgi:prepilin peptidase CpaA|nr:A24 family peptidase [Gammaproteobacteria bacterium]
MASTLPLSVPVLILFGVLLAAAWMDIRVRRIPNWLTYPAILLGLALALLQGGVPLFLNHLLGFFVAGLPMLLLFVSGTLGGGDVKLMAAVGAFIGFPLVFNALISTFMLGGLFALLILIWQGRIFRMTSYAWRSVAFKVNLLSTPPAALPVYKDSLPFGLAIALGSIAVMIPPSWFTVWQN